MDDYYRLLDIDERWTCEQISEHLTGLGRQYRQRVRSNKPEVKEEALRQIERVNQASVHLSTQPERAAYDRNLAGYRAETELQQPLADVDLYRHFQLDVEADLGQITRVLDAAEQQLSEQPAQNEATQRQLGLVMLARRVLLDVAKRTEYDKQLRAKAAYDAQKNEVEAMPLRVNGVEAHSWARLEAILDAHPEEGLHLLKDGEIAAWLRWSQGQRQRADWVQNIAQRAQQSETPYMEFEELLRLINSNRPLHVYKPGKGPEQGAVVTIRHPREIPDLAESHWQLFIQQYDYVADWLRTVGDDALRARFSDVEADPNIRLERMLVAIDPQLRPPGMKIQGVEANVIDFGAVNAWENPASSFVIKHSGRGFLYGAITTSTSWLNVNPTEFAGAQTDVDVWVERSGLASGASNEGHLLITPVDGRGAGIRIQVVVHKHTAFQSVKRLFGGKK